MKVKPLKKTIQSMEKTNATGAMRVVNNSEADLLMTSIKACTAWGKTLVCEVCVKQLGSERTLRESQTNPNGGEIGSV